MLFVIPGGIFSGVEESRKNLASSPHVVCQGQGNNSSGGSVGHPSPPIAKEGVLWGIPCRNEDAQDLARMDLVHELGHKQGWRYSWFSGCSLPLGPAGVTTPLFLALKDYLPSPTLTHKRAFSDDVSQVSPVPEPRATQSPKPKNDPASRSSLCINGSHVYGDEPAPRSPAPVPPGSAPLPVPRRQEEGLGFAPLHPDPHEAPWGAGGFERSQQRDEPRFIPSPPSLALQEELKVSTKAVTLSNHLGRARMEESGRLENRPAQAVPPTGSSSEAAKDQQPEEARKEEKKPKGGFFHHGGSRSEAGSKGQGEKVGPSGHATAAGDERSKSSGWFGSKEPKDSPQKPRHTDPEGESPAKSIGVPVPETTPPSEGDLPPPDTEPAVPPPLSEWDDTFDAFATSRLKPEGKKENFFASLAAEGMAFIDDADAASPTERAAKPAHEKGAQGFEKADSQIGGEMPAALRSWTNFSSLDVGANLVSTTQEATVIEDVLSPVSAGSMGRRRKSSTPMVWTAAFASGNAAEKEASTAGSSTREGGDSDEEESSSAGTNGWMTIATETAPEPSESTQSVAEERVGQDSVFGPRPTFLGDGAFEAGSASRAAARVLPRTPFPPELGPETLPGSNVVAVPPRVAARPLPAPPEPGTEPQGAGNEEGAFDIRTSVYRLQASMRLEASESLVKLSSDIRERHVVLSPWTGTQEREEIVAGSAVPPPKPPRWFAAAGVGGDGEEEEEAPGPQRGKEERGEDTEHPKADVELPRSRASSEPSVPASPSPPALGVDITEAGREFLISKDAESGDSAARASELGKEYTSLREEASEMNETDAAEQFETCASKFSLDGLGQSGAEQSWSQPRLSPQMGPTDSANPHPVKPISAAVQEVSAEKKQQHRSSLTSALSNGLEKLRTVTTSSVQPVAPTSHPEKTDPKKLKDPTVLDQSAKYYHLTHDELIQLLLQREMELSKKEEHIHELENYIDQLLVRIMEQSPTLLQIPLGEGSTK
ncbi:rab11 family-interacting protein 5 isoform X2 [Pitangus sulphuratus]|nr:rab11 family-interacting protein 5 isoform X2 [Pitangus sulphuratus]